MSQTKNPAESPIPQPPPDFYTAPIPQPPRDTPLPGDPAPAPPPPPPPLQDMER